MKHYTMNASRAEESAPTYISKRSLWDLHITVLFQLHHLDHVEVVEADGQGQATQKPGECGKALLPSLTCHIQWTKCSSEVLIHRLSSCPQTAAANPQALRDWYHGL